MQRNLANSPKMGRPGLGLDSQRQIQDRLLAFDRGSENYRRERRVLAMEFSRTESAIEKIFRKLLKGSALDREKCEGEPQGLEIKPSPSDTEKGTAGVSA